MVAIITVIKPRTSRGIILRKGKHICFNVLLATKWPVIGVYSSYFLIYSTYTIFLPRSF